MQFEQIARPIYSAEVILQDYMLRAAFQPPGPVLSYLNDDRLFAQFTDVAIDAFDLENPLNQRRFQLLMVQKKELTAISIRDEEAADTAQLMINTHDAIVYTNRFAIKGKIHMGMEDIPLAVLNDSNSNFVGLTDATIYPLKAFAHNPHKTTPLVFLNCRSILFYHLTE